MKGSKKTFEAHGVYFTTETESELIGYCPFSDKADKFYVNKDSLLWSSKTTNYGGNIQQFLTVVSELNEEKFDGAPVELLAENRMLPTEAFENWGIGWNGTEYTIPVKNAVGGLVDIRRVKLGSAIRATTGCSTGLLNAQKMTKCSGTIYICEGEWDAIAMTWLLKSTGNHEDLVVAVPGATIFKNEWTSLFNNRNVVVCYDNDQAGINGELKVYQRIKGLASKLEFLKWPDDYPTGKDIRDWIIYGCIERGSPQGCLDALLSLKTNIPRDPSVSNSETKKVESDKRKPIDRVELIKQFRKWLHIQDEQVLAVTFGMLLANRLQGDPLWMFIVAPPGGMKSELLMTLSKATRIYPMSTLTPHCLVSGMTMQGGGDPSLIPKLDGQVLIVKRL